VHHRWRIVIDNPYLLDQDPTARTKLFWISTDSTHQFMGGDCPKPFGFAPGDGSRLSKFSVEIKWIPEVEGGIKQLFRSLTWNMVR
jgi:hypothetical protein